MKGNIVILINIICGCFLIIGIVTTFIDGSGLPAIIISAIVLAITNIINYKTNGHNEKNIEGKKYLYINHCWNCKKDIDSRINKLCTRCRQHYICSKCGKCMCDIPGFK